MKKVLLSTAAALFILTLTGCANTAPVQTEDHPPQATAEIVLEPSTEPTKAVESKPVLSSASKELSVADGLNETGDSAASAEPEPSTEPNALAVPSADPAPQGTPEPVPQETQALPKVVIQFNVTTQKGTEESPGSEPSAAPEPEPSPTPAPSAESDLPVESTPPAFNINYWISYAQSYARGAGLNLDPTATACWDNPIAAGMHCAYLERDIQSRLSRYAKDESISDVWIWAEQRSDGSYDFYIGYA